MNKITSSSAASSTNRGWIIASVLLLAILIVYVILYPPVTKGEEAVAKVNGTTISKEQLYKNLVSAGGEQTLQRMIDKELIAQEARKASITITDADYDMEIKKIKSQFPSEEEFTQALTYYGMTLEGMKDDIQTQLQIQKLLEPQVTVTDEDIKKFFDDNVESLKTPEQVSVSHIVTATKEEADAILADLKNGADFANTAKEKSIDTATKEAGGVLDYFAKGTKEEAFEAAAFGLTPGSLSEVVETTQGFHVMKGIGHKEAATPTLDEKKEEIREQLVSDEVSTLAGTWMEEKKAAAAIENYLTPSM